MNHDPALRQIVVIIASDDSELRSSLEMLIHSLYSFVSVVIVRNGQYALKAVELFNPSAIIVDNAISDVEAPTLVRVIRGRTTTLPIIVVADRLAAAQDTMLASATLVLARSTALTDLPKALPRLLGL
jgi:DNA-binding response OmpR family regulator